MTIAEALAPPSTASQAALIGRLDLRRRMRDRSILIQVFIAPILIALIVGAAFSTGGGYHTAILLADVDQTPASRSITSAIEAGSEEGGILFIARDVDGVDDVAPIVDEWGTSAAVLIPAGFTADLAAGASASLTVIGDPGRGIDLSIAQSVADGIAASAQSQRVSITTATAASEQFGVPLDEAQLQSLLDQPPIIDVADARFESTFSMIGFFAPAMAMIFLFFVMGAAARSMLAERRQGTLDRVLAGPTSPTAVLLGKTGAVVALGLIGMLTIYLVTSVAFGVDWGDPVGVLLIMVSVVLAIAGFSLIVTGLARSEEQAEALTIIGTLLFAVFGGTFVYTASGLFAEARQFTPNGQALIAFVELSAGEATWVDVLPHVLILLAMGVISGLIGLAAIRKGMAP